MTPHRALRRIPTFPLWEFPRRVPKQGHDRGGRMYQDVAARHDIRETLRNADGESEAHHEQEHPDDDVEGFEGDFGE